MNLFGKMFLLTPFGMCSAHGAAIAITAATYTPAGSSDTPQVLAVTSTVTSVTTSEGTFSNLVGAVSASAAGQRVWRNTDTDPGTDNATLVGLVATNGLLNLTSTSSDIQLGGSFTADTRFFILELTGSGTTTGDPFTVTLIDASDITLDLSFEVAKANFGSALSKFTASREGSTDITLDQSGVTFSLADFTTGTGSAATATGIRFTSASSLDPAVIGIFTVPEPSSALLACLALPALFLRRRR